MGLKRTLSILSGFFVVIALIFQGCTILQSHYVMSSYEGRVIDADTKEPIVGAVVLVVYYYSTNSIAGSNSYVFDGRETLTDENGEFTFIEREVEHEKVRGYPEGSVEIFKPGYGTLSHRRATAVGENKTWPPPEKYIVYELPKLIGAMAPRGQAIPLGCHLPCRYHGSPIT